MKASLRALLSGAIDYAGLFPPAALPLEEAFRNYTRYCAGPDGWMLGRFLCPASRLGELRALVQRSAPPDLVGPWLALVGRGGRTAREYLDGLASDFREIAANLTLAADEAEIRAWSAFRQLPSGGDVPEYRDALGSASPDVGGPPKVRADVYETRLPEGMTDAAALNELVVAATEQIPRYEGGAPRPWTIFFEVPLGENWRDAVRAARKALRRASRRAAVSISAAGPVFPNLDTIRAWPGLKFRCGGLEPAAFPTPEQLAFAIWTAGREGAPLKFTAGLHDPLRHFHEGLRTPVHGFLNVLVANALRRIRMITDEQIQEVLGDERPENFAFTDEELRWKRLRVATRELAAGRSSFGSCSFDEPRDGLRALGLL